MKIVARRYLCNDSVMPRNPGALCVILTPSRLYSSVPALLNHQVTSCLITWATDRQATATLLFTPGVGEPGPDLPVDQQGPDSGAF